jgi:hypothetical protein
VPISPAGDLPSPVGHDVAMDSGITVGGLYEDCTYHPCLCTLADGDSVEGISLIDGSSPRSCSLTHCGPTALTLTEGVLIKKGFRRYVELRSDLDVREALSQLP